AMSVTDTEAQPYLSGGITADMWTDSTAYTRLVDDVLVSSLVVDDTYTVNEDTTLNVPAGGVLNNDTEVFGANLSAMLLSGPAHGLLTLNGNGSFSYT